MILHPRIRTSYRTRGVAIYLTIVLFGGVALGIVLGVTGALSSELRLYQTLISSKRAAIAADATIEEVIYRTAYNRPLSGTESITVNGASSTVSIVTVDANSKEFYSTGYANTLRRKSFASVSKSIAGNFAYGAQIGEGGITMGNNASIDSTGLYNSDVYTSGPVIGGPGVSIDGNVTVSSGILADTSASSTSCATDNIVGRTSPNIDYAQSFVMGGFFSDTLARVSMYVKRNGSPANATIRIMNNSGGAPGSTVLASQTLTSGSVGTVYGWIDVYFATPATLNPSTTYWIVFDSGSHNAKYWYWCSSLANDYVSGNAKYSDDYTAGGWSSALAGDLAFKTYFGGGISKLDSVSVTGIVKADTITNSSVGADAYYQSITSTTVTGTSYPGSPTPPEIGFPIASSTIAQWKSDAEAGGVIGGNCGTSGVAGCNTPSFTLGPKKINGNLTLDNNQTLTLSGTVYVTGNINLSNNSTVRCDVSFGAKSCVLIADGYIDISNNGALVGSGTSGSFILALTTKAGCVGTAMAGCATGNSGMSVSNNVSGALLYADQSLIDISNGATVTAIVGYKLNLSNNAHIIYDNAIMNTVFTSNATSTISGWDVNRWSEF